MARTDGKQDVIMLSPEQVSQLQKLQAMTNDPSLSQQDVLQVQEYIMHQIVSTPSVDAAGTCLPYLSLASTKFATQPSKHLAML